jgi:superfamily I DNA and/or RNA helicase
VTVRCMQKTDDDSLPRRASIATASTNQEIADALDAEAVDVVGGTPWLFARAELRRAFDHLVIDEAGQMSLANVVAIGGVAQNLVLVGDPQQLAQPSKGSHPRGSGVSALEYILQGSPTIVPERGVFLDRSWRMHPDVCAYVSELAYDCELGSIESCGRQRIHPIGGTRDWLTGSGLRWVPVEHKQNRTSSSEEAARVAEIYASLICRKWTNQNNADLDLSVDDILIVAPYNAQVAAIKRVLPNAKVGTVDKFQGQEGAVVIVSMAASSAEDVPRGMEFLYSMNRLNVAVSRARAMCVIVASPQLLAVRCRTVAQVELANGLARFVEMADAQYDPHGNLGRAS